MNEKVILSFIGLLSSNLHAEISMASTPMMMYRHCIMLGNNNCTLHLKEEDHDNFDTLGTPLVEHPPDQIDSKLTELQNTYKEIFGLPPVTNSESDGPDQIEPIITLRSNHPLQNTPNIKEKNDVLNVILNTVNTGDDYRFQTSNVLESRFRNLLISDEKILESINRENVLNSINNESNTTKTDEENTVKADNNTRKDENKTTEAENNTRTFDNNTNIKMEENRGLISLLVTNTVKIENNTRKVDNISITTENKTRAFENNTITFNNNTTIKMEKNKGQSSLLVTYTIFLVLCMSLAVVNNSM